MTKKMKVMGIATAAALAISSMAVYAADTGRAGRTKGVFEARVENGEDMQKERNAMKPKKGDKDVKLDEKLAAGEITQEEYDSKKAEMKTRHEKKDFQNGKKSGFGKDREKPDSNSGTVTEE